MDWQIACKYALRTLPETAMGQAGVYYGKFYADQVQALVYF